MELPTHLTAEDVKNIITEHKTTFIPINDCCMCDYECGFIIYNIDMDIVLYDSGCYCTKRYVKEQSNWQEIADHYNIQTEDKHRESVMYGLKGIPG